MSLSTPTPSVKDFFAALGEDQAALAEYARDQRGLLERSGLDAEAVAALSSGDLDTVAAAVAGERGEYEEHAPPEHTPGTPEHAPAEHTPPEHTPAEHAPAEHAPAEHAPAEHAPAEPAFEHAPDD
jgi:hypothetical protein